MLIENVSEFDAGSWRWPHFTPPELACRCGGRFCAGEYWHAPDFLDALETSGAWAGLSASMAAEAVIGDSYRWVNAARADPAHADRTAVGYHGAVFLKADAAGQTGILDTATFAATAATLWWFGDRGPRREIR